MQERGTVASLSGRAQRPLSAQDHVPGHRSGGRRLLIGVVALAALGLDQLTKSLAVGFLRHGPVHLVGTLYLWLTFNSGAAFGVGQGLSAELIIVGVVLVGILLAVSRRVPSTLAAVAIGLVLGGALGNLADRVLRSNGGAVIDFIYTRYWPTFNVADSCIVVGALLLFLAGRRRAR